MNKLLQLIKIDNKAREKILLKEKVTILLQITKQVLVTQFKTPEKSYLHAPSIRGILLNA